MSHLIVSAQALSLDESQENWLWSGHAVCGNGNRAGECLLMLSGHRYLPVRLDDLVLDELNKVKCYDEAVTKASQVYEGLVVQFSAGTAESILTKDLYGSII